MMISLFDDEQILSAYAKEKHDEAKKEQAIVDATNLLKEGLPAELIVRAIHLPLAEVNALKAQLAQ